MEDAEELLKQVSRIVRKHAMKDKGVPFIPLPEEDDRDPPFEATLIDSDGGSFDVYLGSVSDAMYPKALKEHRVVGIINAAAGQCADIQRIEKIAGNGSQWEHVSFNEPWYKTALNIDSFFYLSIAAEDHPRYKLGEDFEVCVEFLDKVEAACMGMKSRPSVLIHCIQGLNRSAAICVAFLMKRRNLSVLEAVELLASKRPDLLTNRGFLRQLVQLQLQLSAPLKEEMSKPPPKTFTIGNIVER
jgi:protein-tyrosine phosphatase